MAEQSTSSNVNITDAVLNQSPVIKDAENVTINYTQPTSTSSSDEDGDLQMKKEIWKKHLIQQLAVNSEKLMKSHQQYEKSMLVEQYPFAFQSLRDKLLDLYACVGEGKDSSIATKAAEHFPSRLHLPQPMNSQTRHKAIGSAQSGRLFTGCEFISRDRFGHKRDETRTNFKDEYRL
ncbi:unnamed protein product [Clavelina lepadiformis]|uniref:Uncharacterized protein n=1 Tax=Clavelina lepadiformis TaxID=159417 RepID=A0ABP0FNP2_CLALP